MTEQQKGFVVHPGVQLYPRVHGQGRMQDFGEGGVLHELLMKGRGAREARENFCGAHSI